MAERLHFLLVEAEDTSRKATKQEFLNDSYLRECQISFAASIHEAEELISSNSGINVLLIRATVSEHEDGIDFALACNKKGLRVIITPEQEESTKLDSVRGKRKGLYAGYLHPMLMGFWNKNEKRELTKEEDEMIHDGIIEQARQGRKISLPDNVVRPISWAELISESRLFRSVPPPGYAEMLEAWYCQQE